MKKKTKRIIILPVLAALLLAMVIWVIWANTALELNTITLTEENLPDGFIGFRIAHVSDLHNAEIGEGNAGLIQMLRDAQPDIIAITGDIVDCYQTNIDHSLEFAAQAVQIAPCYYVTGNHENRLSWTDYHTLEDGLKALGVHVLNDREVMLTHNGDTLSLVGHKWGKTDKVGELTDHDGYKILLSHQPEDFTNYVAGGYDLVLSGHAHGGQFRLPFIGGLYCPGQGLFPKYDAGLFSENNTDMVVSRGIGNSRFPFRFNNRPEVILIVLQKG